MINSTMRVAIGKIIFLFISVQQIIQYCILVYVLYIFSMDIEFIQEKDRESVFKLMQLCGLDMTEAYQLYLNADNSVEKAMQMHFNEGPSHNANENFGQGISHNNYGANYDNFQQNGDDDQFDVLYQKYKQYKNSGVTFGNRYEIRKNSSFLSSFVPKFIKGEPQSNFKKLVQLYLGRSCPIKFSAQSLSCTLAQSEKLPTIVYILDFAAAVKPKMEEILRNNQITQMVNQQFKNVGIDPNYEIQKKLVQFVDRKKFNNCLVILRVNAVEEIQTISHVNLVTATTKEVVEKLKLAKNTCISKDLDDGHLDLRLHQELMGNFDYQKPMSITQRRKVAQDRQIRKKQQEQFFASMKAQQQKQKNNPQQPSQSQTKPQPTQSSTNKKPAQNKPSVPQPPKRNIAQERKQIRDKLKVYTQGMNIKLRLPDGQAIILTVDPSQKAKYLFNYVESLDKDMGFEKDNDRKFDIIRPYDKLNLSSQQDRTLNDVFEGSESENLVVSQRD